MSFSDPFNRVSRKREKEYLAFHERLKRAGIDTEEKAEKVVQESRGRIIGTGAMVVAVALLVSLIWPGLRGMVLVFGSLIVVWLVTTLIRGQRMMQQYIRQEFGKKR